MSLDRLETLATRGRAMVKRVPSADRSGWCRIGNTTGDRAEVYIYGVIGDDWDGGVTASTFASQLRGITAPEIELHINSPGGLVFDGIAIYSALRNHSATVDVRIDGIAASAASFVAMAGDSVAIEKPAKMMIHDASGLVIGNANDMREMADLLDEMSDTIADIYAQRTKLPAVDWRAAMRKETWYSAEDAVSAGLADMVLNGDGEKAPANRRSQLIRARHRVHMTP